MNQRCHVLIPVVLLMILVGCASVKETAKVIWGSSTQALEEARADAISQSYSCPLEKCREEVLAAASKSQYIVFINDLQKNLIVLMGIKGSVNTTEVGVFFVDDDSDRTRIEITSLSSNAKQIVAKTLFSSLDVSFSDSDSTVNPQP